MQGIVTDSEKHKACIKSSSIELHFAHILDISHICENDPNIQVMMSSVFRKDKIKIFHMYIICQSDSSSQVSRSSKLAICKMG